MEIQVMIYFAFTTMSTVGFGDFSPRSNLERMVGSFLLLLGVAIFSFILGVFLDLINQFKELNKGIADETGLLTFIDCLEKFNKNVPLDDDFMYTIHRHFNLKWKNDKNQGFGESDYKIFSELPQSVILRVMTDYLYPEFIEQSKSLFRLRNQSKLDVEYCYYSFYDEKFCQFMLHLMMTLEFRSQLGDEYIVEENKEWLEVIFFNTGKFAIGFNVNHQEHTPKIINCKDFF